MDNENGQREWIAIEKMWLVVIWGLSFYRKKFIILFCLVVCLFAFEKKNFKEIKNWSIFINDFFLFVLIVSLILNWLIDRSIDSIDWIDWIDWIDRLILIRFWFCKIWKFVNFILKILKKNDKKRKIVSEKNWTNWELDDTLTTVIKSQRINNQKSQKSKNQ